VEEDCFSEEELSFLEDLLPRASFAVPFFFPSLIDMA